MSHSESFASSNLFDEFKTCAQIQFNGKLDIKTPKGNWSFYYRLGRIVWATGGNQAFRRLCRHIEQFCPQMSIDSIKLSHSEVTIEHWDYQLLRKLHQEKQIKREQVNIITENIITELLFDIVQQANSGSINCDRINGVVLDTATTFTSADMSLKETQYSFQTWTEAGLANISPNLAPVLRKPEGLQKLVSERVYRNFLNIINGRYTLRELAIKVKQDLLVLSRSLLPYIRKEIIELVEVADLPLPLPQTENVSQTQSVNQTPNDRPIQSTIQSRSVTQSHNTVNKNKAITDTGLLIACVDDSPQTSEILQKILTPQGLSFIGIQDSLQAIPILIERKPDLIFLDLIMPIANGYEICAQLRRVSVLSNTPVVILTGSDGLVDRVRAKMVGATDFLSKPVVAQKVIAMINKHVKKQSPITNLQMCAT